MKHLSWITLHPELFENERRLIEQQYRGLTLCATQLSMGALVYHGEVTVNSSDSPINHKVLLLYPDIFPYRIPRLIPIKSLPPDEPHDGWLGEPEIISARHQMADGNLCLVEEDPFRETAHVVRGIDVLRRAKTWIFGVKSGHTPYDSLEADLQSHYRKLGDLLIGPECFDLALKTGGQFYAARLLEDGASPRFVALGLSSDLDAIPIYVDSRRSLEKPFPWIQTDFWDAAQQIAQGSELFKQKIREGILLKGYWWDLDIEPKPPRTGGDIVRLVSRGNHPSDIERTIDIFRGDISTDSSLTVGLRFPDRRGGYDWIFLIIGLRDKRQPNPLVMTSSQKLELLDRSSLYAFHRHGLVKRELSLRNSLRVPQDLDSRKISFLGTGALGSQVADLFTKAGLGKARLHDCDIMTLGNASRHQCGIESFGLPKVGPVALHMVQHNPFIDVTAEVLDISSTFESIEAAISDCDFAISTLADESVEAAINQVATSSERTLYYARVMRGGAVGRIFRVIPGRDACRYCISRYMATSSNDDQNSQWLRIPETEDSLLTHECGNPVIAGSAADLSIVASLATRVILNELTTGPGDDNHWLWTSEAIPEHPALAEPFRLVSRRFLPEPSCPYCSDPLVRRVVVPADVQAQMEIQASSSGENETGGILVGHFSADSSAIVTGASDAGPNAESSPIHFSRDVEYTQRWLDEQIRATEMRVEYIGEWHSHPSEDTNPSITDVTSLAGIANAENYLCSKPVALILGCVEGNVVRRSAYSFAPNRPYRAIEYTTEERAE